MLKNRFPIFENRPELCFLDNASTTQKPDVVIEALNDFYKNGNANVHRGLYELSENATENYEAVREKVRSFLNAKESGEIVFTHGATEALNLVANAWALPTLKAGDEILLSVLEHHSNIVPWQLCAKKTGAKVLYVPIKENGELDYEAFEKMLSPKTKLLSLTGLSNTLGTLVDFERIVKSAKKVGAKVLMDAAQLVAHKKVDVQALDLDFLVFSSHKLYGPMGAGVLYVKKELLASFEPWMGGGGMIKEVHESHSEWNDSPWKFEAGTPSVANVIGLGAALDFLNEVGMEKIEAHEKTLFTEALEKLGQLSFLKILGPQDPEKHCAVISFTMDGIHPHDVSGLLGEDDICVRAGHHCTMPLMKNMKLSGTTRISLGLYNDSQDLDKLCAALQKTYKRFQ